ncbi:MAG: PIG-L family deacetylase [Chthoniobacterales bacterium]|nr:PIG-L family deacetylase [Chthoniobacterales bacterium]
MLQFNIPQRANNILCLGAHADDIEIGCGGTLLKWAAERPDLNVRWVVFTAEGKRAGEARASAKALLLKTSSKVIVKNFRGSFLPFQGTRIKEFLETLKESYEPDLVFTHYREDRHQDHRLLSDLAWNTFRNHLVLEYEIPKYDGDLGTPNLFVPLDRELSLRKAAHLCRHFQTQTNKHWFSEETFLALMRLRGVECGARYAEAFYCRKLVCA